jgi:DNA invertase Pin-like site-specific DNA recombinase
MYFSKDNAQGGQYIIMSNQQPKAIALCRVSTKGQMRDGNLEPQETRIIKAAEIIDVEIVKWWQVAVSSRKGKNTKRKDLMEMLEYSKRYKSVKYIIVDEVDRFMRSIGEYYWWKMEFQLAGVELRLANRPDADTSSDRAVFDELIDVYRAESSNNERIVKTPDKMMAKVRAGYYPSNPHTGYKVSDIPGLHIPDEPNWGAMQQTFREMARGEYSVSEGLKKVTERGLRTKHYGPGGAGGRKIDMYRWKDLMTNSYYCGVVKLADWPAVNENGLHTPMITPEEHQILVALVKNKGKRFIVNNDNPEFPLSNEAECARCVLAENPYPRMVGYWQNNGKAKGYKRYKRYRCRDCNLGIRQEAFHDSITEELSQLLLTSEQKEKLKERSRKVWTTYERTRIEKARIELNRVAILKNKKSEMIQTLSKNPELADDIKEEIEKVKKEIVTAERVAAEAQDFEKDFSEFIDFAFDYLDSLKGNWWELSKESRKVCKQMIFPSGIQLLPNKKVYIPEISLVYRYGTQKTAPERADITRMEGQMGLEPMTPCLKGRCSNQLSYWPTTLCTI